MALLTTHINILFQYLFNVNVMSHTKININNNNNNIIIIPYRDEQKFKKIGKSKLDLNKTNRFD